jgi:hypothetical protein
VPAHVQNNVQIASGPLMPSTGPANAAKPEDIVMEEATITTTTPKPILYTKYSSAPDILYAPEDALKEGLGMVKSINSSLKTIQLGSKLRQDVWLRELER